jgi:hypothetical protein
MWTFCLTGHRRVALMFVFAVVPVIGGVTGCQFHAVVNGRLLVQRTIGDGRRRNIGIAVFVERRGLRGRRAKPARVQNTADEAKAGDAFDRAPPDMMPADLARKFGVLPTNLAGKL